jgi:ABC-type amino acid transport substrate-binding protein
VRVFHFTVLLCALCTGAARAAPLRVCYLSHNLPYSEQDPQRGFDLDTGRAVAALLGREFAAVWTSNPATIQEVEETDIPLNKLARNGCDVIFSVPGPAAQTLKRLPEVALGAAYYGAAFELIGAKEISPRLTDLRAQAVAIQAQTVASFALAMLHGKQRTYFTPRTALEDVANGKADAALLWGPTAGWALQQPPQLALTFAQGYTPPAALSWNLHAATRKGDETTRAAVDKALATLATKGELTALAKRYGFRLYAPFAVTYSLTEMNKLR